MANPPSDARFLMMRIAYRVVLTLWFVLIGFRWGPNLINFGRLSSLSVDDFVPTAQAHTPVIAAIKQYQADHGHLPESLDSLVPEYLPKDWQEHYPGEGALGGSEYEVLCWQSNFVHVLRYNLYGNDEHWEVSGGIVRGRLPLPSVPAPATRSAVTQP